MANANKKLPHGIVPFQHIADVQVREAIMKLNENIRNLDSRIAELERKGKETRR